MGRLRIQVVTDDIDLSPEVRASLKRIDAGIVLDRFDSPPAEAAQPPIDARLIVTSDARTMTNGKLGRLLQWYDHDPCGTLVLSQAPVGGGSAPEDATGCRPIDFASCLTVEDLSGRLAGLAALREPLTHLRERFERLERREAIQRAGIRQMEEELQFASSLQRNLRCDPPIIQGADLHTLCRSATTVSGDTYEVARLDETHIGIALADATGHGLAAGLLSTYVQGSFRAKESIAGTCRLLAPDEVLARANRELLNVRLEECHFVAALFAVYNEQTSTISWARGGAPYPILLRSGDRPRQVISDGTLLGVIPDAAFEVVTLKLKPGDALIIHSDGVESVTVGRDQPAADRRLDRSAWFRSLGDRPVAESLATLERLRVEAEVPSEILDDITVLALQVRNRAAGKCDPRETHAEELAAALA